MILTTKIKLTPQNWSDARANYERVKHVKFRGSPEMVLNGIVGQSAFVYHMTKEIVEWRDLPHGDGGYDLIYKGHVLDVKTKARNGYVREDYNCDVSLYQWKLPSKPGLIYVFCSLNQLTDEIEIVGWMEKEEMRKLARVYYEGDKLPLPNGKVLTFREASVNVYVREVHPIEELKYLE